MITYNDIYEASRKERYSEQLQPLPKNFIKEIAEYLKEKKEISQKEDDTFSEVIIKTKKQLENAITLFRELILRRRRKILNLVLIAVETGISKKDFDNMLNSEKELFEKLMECTDAFDKNLNSILNGAKSKEETKNTMIMFKENLGELMDLNGEQIGPFEKGQIANIPKEIAKIIVEDGKAEVIEK